jgi:hypothetical protein
LSKIIEKEKRQFAERKLGEIKSRESGAKSRDLASLKEAVRAGKKIERDTSAHCQKCEMFNLVKYF